MKTITYKEIKPLVADATISNNRLLCKFHDPTTNQIVLSAAEVPASLVENQTVNGAGFLKRALARINFSKDIAKSPEEEEAIVKAFQKVSHLFEKHNDQVKIRQ